MGYGWVDREVLYSGDLQKVKLEFDISEVKNLEWQPREASRVKL